MIVLCFSKEISGFAALKRTIREVEKGPANESGNKSQIRVHKKKKDAMVSPKKPPNAWTAFLTEKLKEVSLITLLLPEFYAICLSFVAFAD